MTGGHFCVSPVRFEAQAKRVVDHEPVPQHFVVVGGQVAQAHGDRQQACGLRRQIVPIRVSAAHLRRRVTRHATSRKAAPIRYKWFVANRYERWPGACELSSTNTDFISGNCSAV